MDSEARGKSEGRKADLRCALRRGLLSGQTANLLRLHERPLLGLSKIVGFY
jgi:hypothetical protein